MATALATLMNHAMQIEREQMLQTEAHQRTVDLKSWANGFKPEVAQARAAKLDAQL